MNWRTGVRIGVAVVGLTVAAAVFYKSRTGPPPPALPPDAPRLDPNVSLLGGATRITFLKGGKPSVEVTAESNTRYVDGRARFERAVIKGLGDNAFTLRGAVVETKGPAVAGENPSQLTISGGFTFEGSDGMIVESDKGDYDDATGVMAMPGAVAFRRGRISGTSTGATYERANDTVTLLDAANAVVAADAQGKGAATATSKRMLLARGQHSLQMSENARIVGEAQELSGRDATVLFTDDESAMKYLELRGSARVSPAKGAAPGQPAMTADNLTMAFHADGIAMQHATLTGRAALTTTDKTGSRSIRASWIDLFTGLDGRTLTSLQARDKVIVDIPATASTTARAITAATLAATGDEKRGLTSARFEGEPCFQESAAAQAGKAAPPVDPAACSSAFRAARAKASSGTAGARLGTATVLVLKLGGQLDAIEEAEFQQNAEFADGRVSASADRAVYSDLKDILFLTPNAREPRRQSRVVTSDMTVTANEIDVYLEKEDLKARGVVRTSSIRKAEKGKPTAGSLFEGDAPIFGTADTLDYVKDTGKATYNGAAGTRAQLKQDTTDISATKVEFTQDDNYLVATGQVNSTLLMSAPSTDGKGKALAKTYTVQADKLTYDDARRVAVYEVFGAPLVVMTTDDGNRTESRKLTFELAKDSRTLERMRAEGAVFATMSDGYEARGDVLVYRADTEVYTITGKPAIAKSREKSGECKRTESAALELNRKTGAVYFPPPSPAQPLMEKMNCSDSIRPIKK